MRAASLFSTSAIQDNYMKTPLSLELLCTDFHSSAVPRSPVFCLFYGVTLAELQDDNTLTSNLVTSSGKELGGQINENVVIRSCSRKKMGGEDVILLWLHFNVLISRESQPLFVGLLALFISSVIHF